MSDAAKRYKKEFKGYNNMEKRSKERNGKDKKVSKNTPTTKC